MGRGVYKRPDSKKYWINYAGPDGKTIRESTGSDKHRDAEALLIKRKRMVLEGRHPELKGKKKHTFRDFAEKYSAWMEGRHRSANSKSYRIKDMVERFGNLPLSRFDTNLVETYQTNLINKGLKPASVNKNISLLKAMINKAVDWDMTVESTLKKVRKVKALKENNKRLRYLSKEEIPLLIENCDKHLRPIVITALNTGMRKSEVLGLRWDMVDLKNGFILLDKTKNNARREIPINETLRETLSGIIRRLDVPYIFINPSEDKPYKDVKNSFRAALRRSGINNFHFHDLRHTFASHMVMSGVDITTIKELLGHKSLTMTLRYAHLAPGHKKMAVETLDRALQETSTSRLLHVSIKEGVTHNA